VSRFTTLLIDESLRVPRDSGVPYLWGTSQGQDSRQDHGTQGFQRHRPWCCANTKASNSSQASRNEASRQKSCRQEKEKEIVLVVKRPALAGRPSIFSQLLWAPTRKCDAIGLAAKHSD